MICSQCAWEADTQQSGESTAEEIAEANAVVAEQHNDSTDLRVGHAACKGCDCHHYPAVLTGEGRVRQWKR